MGERQSEAFIQFVDSRVPGSLERGVVESHEVLLVFAIVFAPRAVGVENWTSTIIIGAPLYWMQMPRLNAVTSIMAVG